MPRAMRLVAPALRRVGDELLVPHVDLGEVGEPALGERAQEVQARGRLVVGLQHARRVGHAGGGVRRVVVDHVAAERRQLDAVHHLGVAGARLGELAGRARQLDHRQGGAVGEHRRHLQHDLEVVADARRREVAEALGAVARVQQEAAPRGDLGQGAAQLARLAGEHERRHGPELRRDRVDGGGVRPVRLLVGRQAAPGVGGPLRACLCRGVHVSRVAFVRVGVAVRQACARRPGAP